jgi:DNA repair protein RadC
MTEREDPPATYSVSQVARRRARRSPPQLEGPEDLYRLLKPLLANQDREQFYVVPLSTKHHVLAVELVSVGSLNASIVHPREVFKPAIRCSAAAIVVGHNHPSGVAEPSNEDREFTQRLQRAGQVLGIRLLDHLIVGDGSYVSLRKEGVLS